MMTDLDDVLPCEQIAQLTRLLAAVMASGFGTVEIEVVRGRVRFIRQQLSFSAEYGELNRDSPQVAEEG
jgi:hypothetical protein